ncbi:MAG: hypothetical protein COX30_04435 [Candidatus Moranbacteria bacterium CG23_combo_of_CG06-09_8_20_14_all_39_10]|nr:MAG: hypothetical protein COX30_04435 [Candidatus Moranbacteria bacterium CG23_combo_of_CG06-09_8_20_14_all_39_10]
MFLKIKLLKYYKMFEKFIFSDGQVEKYYKSASRDFKIANQAEETEVNFRFCYDALLKLAIAVCAKNNLRIKSRQGHHIKLIDKLAEIFRNDDIKIIGQEMRSKRNWDLYGGGILISKKEAAEYLKWTADIFRQGDDYLHKHKRLL